MISKIDSTTGSLNRYETGLGPLIGVASSAWSLYIQVVFNGKCIGTLPNWRLVAGGGNRQVKLRAGSNVQVLRDSTQPAGRGYKAIGRDRYMT